MTTPKPAPSKPLTFTPPVFLKGETRSSELPTVEGAEPNVISKKKAPKFKNPQHHRADGFREANKIIAKSGLPEAKVTGKIQGVRPAVVIIDEIFHADGTVELSLGTDQAKKDLGKEKKPETKKPFVLNEHLTQRPFHDDRLMQLKSRLQRPSFKNR